MKVSRFTLTLLGIGVLHFVAMYLLDFNGLYGQDCYEYARYTSAWKQFMMGQGEYPGDYFWPLGYPVISAAVSIVTFLSVPKAMMLVCIASLLGSTMFLRSSLLSLVPKHRFEANTFLLLFFVLSPALLLSASLNMSDALALFFLSVFLFAFVKSRTTERGVWLVWAAFFSCMSFFTRYAGAVIMIPMVVSMSWEYVKLKRWKYLAGAGLVSMALFAVHWWIKKDVSFVEHPWLSSWSILNAFGSSFDTPSGQSSYPFPNVVYGLYAFIHPIFCLLAVLLLFLARKAMSLPTFKILLVALACYYLFVVGIPFQNKRFLLPMIPLMALVLFPGFVRLTQWVSHRVNPKFNTVILIGLTLFQLVMFVHRLGAYVHLNASEKAVAEALRKHNPHKVYSLSMYPSLSYYLSDVDVQTIYDRKGLVLSKGDYLVFNQRNENQWENSATGEVWFFHKDKLKPVGEPIDGWIIYRMP